MNDELRDMRKYMVGVELGELISITSGNAFKKNEYTKNGVRLFQIANVSFNTTSWDKSAYLPQSYLTDEKYKHLVLNKDDIVMALNRPLLNKKLKISQLSVFDVPAILYQRVGKFNIVDGLFPKYLLYYLQSPIFIKWLSEELRGVNIPFINQSKLLKYNNFPLFPSTVQRAIVSKIESLFSDLDNGIASLKKAQEQLKIYRQAVLKKAFEGELTKEWRKQRSLSGVAVPTAKELLKEIKEERENHYNQQIEDWEVAVKEWEESKLITNDELGIKNKKPSKPKAIKELPPLTEAELNDLPKLSKNGFYIRMGNLSDVVRGGSPRPAGDDRYYNGKIPFLKVADLTRSKTKYVSSFSYTIKEAGLHKTRLLEIGTLVISNSGATLGVPRILAIQATANDGIAAFLGLNKDMIDYLFFYWDSKTIALRNINQGAGQPNLNTDLLKDFPVPIFSIPEQHQIVQEIEFRLSVCDKVEQSISESLQKANALRQSILKKAFEGKLLSEAEIEACKKEEDYEPANILLARIERSRNEKNKKEKLRMTKERKPRKTRNS